MKSKFRLLLSFMLAIAIAGLVINTTQASEGRTALAKTANKINQQTTTSSFTLYLPAIQNGSDQGQAGSAIDWPMAAANPERTSWSPNEVTGNLHVEWYRPIEAYIPQNVQVIASKGLLYVSTSKGLYALNSTNGALIWRYDTEMPLGNSPSVDNGVVYVGGYDRKLHALEASTGHQLWEFSGAQAGYDTNPLVINGKVFIGNRDGNMYAIGANGTPQQGKLIWKYQTGGPIHLSAAYKDGVIYFAANDNFAYALRASDGTLVWKSDKLPGDGYQSYWPVIYRDEVIFSAAKSYRPLMNPGTISVDGDNNDLKGIWPELIEGSLIGPEIQSQDWAHGFPMVDVHRLTEYYEDNPTDNSNPHAHKPWRRPYIVLNLATGKEFTFDSDKDGSPEYLPVYWWHTGSGNLYPGIVGPDNILYNNNAFRCCSDAKGKVYGWNIDAPSLLSMVGSRWYGDARGGFAAMAEPQAISGGGNIIYRNLCCDRVADWFSITQPLRSGTLWSYNLGTKAPGYDEMWFAYPVNSRLWAWYQGKIDFYQNKDVDPYTYNSVNGIYASHGIQNPLIPYNGRLYTHRGNAIIAYGTGQESGKLPLIEIQGAQDKGQSLSQSQLLSRLSFEIQKIIEAGHLRPGYYVISQHPDYKELADYFDNPGDTLYTLSIAYPFLSSNLQTQVQAYLAQEFSTYFDPEMYATTGWLNGEARESMPLPDDIIAYMTNLDPNDPNDKFLFPRTRSYGFSWTYPPHNFYAMYQYAKNIPGVDPIEIYNLAKSKLQVPVPSTATTEYFMENPYEHNAYLTGYIGFLKLQELAGMSTQDSTLRQEVTAELDRLLKLKVQIFSKDTWWIENPKLFPDNPDRTNNYQRKEMDIARNFMWLVPELGDYLNQNIRDKVQVAVDEYSYVAPYWFVSRYEAFPGEGVRSVLWNYPALFQARAYILKESQEELTKYIDVPAFERGDLFYIQDLVAAIEAHP